MSADIRIVRRRGNLGHKSKGTTTSYCECCWTNSVTKRISDKTSAYCKPCVTHYNSAVNIRADHRAIAEQARTALIAQRAQAIVGDENTVTGLQQELISRSNVIEALRAEKVALQADRDALAAAIAANFIEGLSPNLVTLIRTETIHELEGEKDGAYRTRDRAMGAIWRAMERHHERIDGKCACGKMASGCPDLDAIAFFRDPFDRWEKRQIELMKAGKFHGLPRDHSEATKYQDDRIRSWRGASSTRPEAHSGRRI